MSNRSKSSIQTNGSVRSKNSSHNKRSHEKAPPGSKHAIAGNSCRTCKSFDTSPMAHCVHCDDWHHFACVGVTQDIEQNSWCCPSCEKATQQSSKPDGESKQTAKTKTTGSSASKKDSKKAAESIGDNKKKATGAIKKVPIVSSKGASTKTSGMQTRKAKKQLAEKQERSKAASFVSASSKMSTRGQLEAEI